MNNNRFTRRGKYESARTRSIRSAYQSGRAAFLNEQARQRAELAQERADIIRDQKREEFQASPEK
jgi:hypothetical protein